MELVAFVGADKENWGQISAILNRGEWDKVVLVKNKYADGFLDNGAESIKIKSDLTVKELKEEIMEKLKNKTGRDFEVAVSLASGNGKEHMALISALLSLPVGVKLVVFTKNGIDFLS